MVSYVIHWTGFVSSLHRILQLYAEESAVDDTIYYIGEALRKDVIEVEVSLKVCTCVFTHVKLVELEVPGHVRFSVTTQQYGLNLP